MGLRNDLKNSLTLFMLLSFLQAISAPRAPADAPSPYAQAPSCAPTPSPAPSPSQKPPILTTFSDPIVSKDSFQVNELQVFHTTSAASGIENMNLEVKKLCDATDYTAVCQSSILPLSNSAQGSSAPTVLQLAIKAAIDETNMAMSTTQKFVNSPKIDSDLAASLDDCKSSYENILSGFKDAQDAILQNDKGTLNSMLSAAISDIETCDDGFDEANPVATHNQKLIQLTSNSLAIAAEMKL